MKNLFKQILANLDGDDICVLVMLSIVALYIVVGAIR